MLIMSDGMITLGQILTPGWRRKNINRVELFCCRINFTITEITDEPLTLAAGFLIAGARNVIATLWSVEEIATSLLSVFYHEELRQNNSTTALQKSQLRLRHFSEQ